MTPPLPRKCPQDAFHAFMVFSLTTQPFRRSLTPPRRFLPLSCMTLRASAASGTACCMGSVEYDRLPPPFRPLMLPATGNRPAGIHAGMPAADPLPVGTVAALPPVFVFAHFHPMCLWGVKMAKLGKWKRLRRVCSLLPPPVPLPGGKRGKGGRPGVAVLLPLVAKDRASLPCPITPPRRRWRLSPARHGRKRPIAASGRRSAFPPVQTGQAPSSWHVR